MDRHIHFYEAIKEFIPASPFTLVDYCCGDASLGALFDSHHFVQNIIFIDIKRMRGLGRKINRLSTPFEISFEGIESHNPSTNSFVVALHSCGELTDRVIEKAVAARNPFAVMPCCYKNGMNSLRPSSHCVLPVSYSYKDYYDALRMEYVKERGYNAKLRLINRRTTPMNHVIIGIPLHQNTNA